MAFRRSFSKSRGADYRKSWMIHRRFQSILVVVVDDRLVVDVDVDLLVLEMPRMAFSLNGH